MKSQAINYWHKKIDKYRQEDWASAPSIFVQSAERYFAKNGSILEIGSGAGADGFWLASKGYRVTQLDLEDYRSAKFASIPFVSHNLDNPLDFEANSFDVIYSHLALHYFTHKRTEALFHELGHLLRADGILAFIVNSSDDPECGVGKKIEHDVYFIDGYPKRFFTVESAVGYCKDMEIILADNKGVTHKDMKQKGVGNLIRVLCKKK